MWTAWRDVICHAHLAAPTRAQASAMATSSATPVWLPCRRNAIVGSFSLHTSVASGHLLARSSAMPRARARTAVQSTFRVDIGAPSSATAVRASHPQSAASALSCAVRAGAVRQSACAGRVQLQLHQSATTRALQRPRSRAARGET